MNQDVNRINKEFPKERIRNNLDNNEWIKKGFLKCESRYSNVLCFETNDPKRFDQLLNNIGKAPVYEEVILYDKWNGLRKLDKDFLREKGGIKFIGFSVGITNRLNMGDKKDTSESNVVDIVDALRRTEKILKNKRTVLILRNLEDSKDQLTRSEVLVDAVRSWAIDPDIIFYNSVIILVASDVSKLLDDYTLSLVVLIRPDIASKIERETIIKIDAEKMDINHSEYQLNTLVDVTSGLNLHQIESTLLEAYYSTADKEIRSFDLPRVKEIKSDLIRRSDLIEVVESDDDFNSIGGYNEIKEFVTTNIIDVQKNKGRANKLALKLPRGILLYGPPGTGKTYFAKALAKETNLPFINMKTENLYGKYLGESGQRFRTAIEIANQMSPAIVFIDEIDRFGKRTGGGDDGASQETSRVFSQVLEWLGDPKREAIIVGTTNEPGHMDDAFLRTGRFDYKIPFLYPNKEARKEILKIHLGLKGNKKKPNMDEEDIIKVLDQIVGATKDFSGAEIEELVNRAKRNAFKSNRDQLRAEDLIYASKCFILPNRKEIKEKYNRMISEYTDNIEFSKLSSFE